MADYPILPDAQPYDTYLIIVVAVLVVWFNRKAMFTRVGAVTEVIPHKLLWNYEQVRS